MIDIDKLYIVNYCHPSCVPLRNIMSLSKQEAFELAQEMSKDSDCTSFGRFADFENYYPLRKRADEHIYNAFVSLGGKPMERHPLSFVLEGSEYLSNWFDKGKVTKILLKDIPSDYISFTYGDSAATFSRQGKVFVMTKEMILDSMRNFSGTIEQYMEEMQRKHYYIEVQFWGNSSAAYSFIK